jgi:CrcB protein
MNRFVILVGMGSLLGGIFRFLVGNFFAQKFFTAFPLGTLAVNLIGCFLIGICFGLSERGNVLSPEWRIFLTTGFCGGFTTFSTFSYESIRLIEDGELLFVLLNVAISVIVGFIATYLGILLVKSI